MSSVYKSFCLISGKKKENFINKPKLHSLMASTQTRSKRSVSGGRYKSHRKKRIYETARSPTSTKIGKIQTKVRTIKGGKKKISLLHVNIVNLKSKNKNLKAKIITVKESPANRHFIRRNILTKGTIIETDKGLAKITNRPGQEGSVNATLVK